MADLRPLNRTIGRPPGRKLTSYRQKAFRDEIHDARDDGVPTCDDNDWHSEIPDIPNDNPGPQGSEARQEGEVQHDGEKDKQRRGGKVERALLLEHAD